MNGFNFGEQIGTIDIPEVSTRRAYDGPPRIYRYNPKEANKPGLFYISERECAGLPPAAPWSGPVERFSGEMGWQTERLSMVLIASRSQAFRNKLDSGNKVIGRIWQPKWVKDGPQKSTGIYTEYLVLPEGFVDEAGNPREAVWVVKGMLGKKAQELFNEYRESLLREANAVATQKAGRFVRMPDWSFRIPVGPKRDRRGYVVEKHPSFPTSIQPPTLLLPDEITERTLDELFVGPDMLHYGKELWDRYEEWRSTMRQNDEEESFDEGATTLQDAQERAREARETLSSRGYPVSSGSSFGAGVASVFPEEDVEDIPF